MQVKASRPATLIHPFKYTNLNQRGVSTLSKKVAVTIKPTTEATGHDFSSAKIHLFAKYLFLTCEACTNCGEPAMSELPLPSPENPVKTNL